MHRTDIESRYSQGLGRSLVETDVKVRSTIGRKKGNPQKEVSDVF
jgi:hypothetical protein